MYCNSCGRVVQPGQPFCAGCGRPVAGVAVGAPVHHSKGRVAEHIGIVAALWLVAAALTLFGGFFFIAMSNVPFTRFMTPSQLETMPFEQARSLTNFIQGLFVGLAVISIAQAAAGFLAGWGLIQRKPWARTLTLILAFLGLLSFPLGTALGVYTIWVLLAGNAEQEYRRLAAHASHS